MDFGVIAFSNTHSAMRTERYLREKFPIQMMPTLRNIAVTCGISVRFRPRDAEGVAAAMRELNLPREDYQIYGVEYDGRIVDLK